MEDWAEIRRLHRAEGVPIKAIARQMGIARNTVRSALASEAPPKYQRAGKQSLVDAAEPEVRKLLRLDARMPATVIAERIGWEHSITILKDRIRQIRPEYVGVDPADRIVHEPGQAAQMDLWFPEPRIPVGFGQAAMLPVLVMTLTFSKFLSAVMLPSRQAGDLLAGMWQLISQVGAVSKTLVWDREAAIGGKGVVTQAQADHDVTDGDLTDVRPRLEGWVAGAPRRAGRVDTVEEVGHLRTEQLAGVGEFLNGRVVGDLDVMAGTPQGRAQVTGDALGEGDCLREVHRVTSMNQATATTTSAPSAPMDWAAATRGGRVRVGTLSNTMTSKGSRHDPGRLPPSRGRPMPLAVTLRHVCDTCTQSESPRL